jgi:hypothetical protein
MAVQMVKTPLPNFIRFGRDICGNLAEAERVDRREAASEINGAASEHQTAVPVTEE